MKNSTKEAVGEAIQENGELILDEGLGGCERDLRGLVRSNVGGSHQGMVLSLVQTLTQGRSLRYR